VASARPSRPPSALSRSAEKTFSDATVLPHLAARLQGPGTYAVLGSDADRALVRRIRATAGALFHRRP